METHKKKGKQSRSGRATPQKKKHPVSRKTNAEGLACSDSECECRKPTKSVLKPKKGPGPVVVADHSEKPVPPSDGHSNSGHVVASQPTKTLMSAHHPAGGNGRSSGISAAEFAVHFGMSCLAAASKMKVSAPPAQIEVPVQVSAPRVTPNVPPPNAPSLQGPRVQSTRSPRAVCMPSSNFNNSTPQPIPMMNQELYPARESFFVSSGQMNASTVPHQSQCVGNSYEQVRPPMPQTGMLQHNQDWSNRLPDYQARPQQQSSQVFQDSPIFNGRYHPNSNLRFAPSFDANWQPAYIPALNPTSHPGLQQPLPSQPTRFVPPADGQMRHPAIPQPMMMYQPSGMNGPPGWAPGPNMPRSEVQGQARGNYSLRPEDFFAYVSNFTPQPFPVAQANQPVHPQPGFNTGQHQRPPAGLSHNPPRLPQHHPAQSVSNSSGQWYNGPDPRAQPTRPFARAFQGWRGGPIGSIMPPLGPTSHPRDQNDILSRLGGVMFNSSNPLPIESAVFPPLQLPPNPQPAPPTDNRPSSMERNQSFLQRQMDMTGSLIGRQAENSKSVDVPQPFWRSQGSLTDTRAQAQGFITGTQASRLMIPENNGYLARMQQPSSATSSSLVGSSRAGSTPTSMSLSRLSYSVSPTADQYNRLFKFSQSGRDGFDTNAGMFGNNGPGGPNYHGENMAQLMPTRPETADVMARGGPQNQASQLTRMGTN